VGPRPPREFKRRFLAEIIEPRVEEIFLLAQQELVASGCAELAASGLVLTGGAAQMEGMLEIAEDIFQMPVRKGVPSGVATARAGRSKVRLTEGGFAGMIQDPKFATGVGLVLYGAAHEPLPVDVAAPRVVGGKPRGAEDGPGIARRFTSWVREMF
jgi:cell division protein FtsA